MAKQILVPLKRQDRVEDIMPYVESVAQPGTKVVFLVRYPAESFASMLHLFAKLESGMPERLAATRQLARIYTWEGNVQSAKRKASHAREVLERKGVEVDAEVYTGSWKKAVRRYAPRGNVHLVITRARPGFGITRFLRRGRRLLRQHDFSPLRVVHPGTLS